MFGFSFTHDDAAKPVTAAATQTSVLLGHRNGGREDGLAVADGGLGVARLPGDRAVLER
jgi:hypothetical protein